MPVYLFTFHAYRSWSADNPRGFVQRGARLQAPNPRLAEYYAQRADQAPVLFEPFHQEVLIWIVCDACKRRGWRAHFVATEPTHIHILVSWRSARPWREVGQRIKTLASLMLGRKIGRSGQKWFSRGGSRKRVRTRKHFNHLVDKYLPGHGGLQWREGDQVPVEPRASDRG